ncbi:MAG TPA: DUF4365 domain-containing protein [Thermoanaerobaculia bacterium]|nr:DUF4365 domain-containing protein [Thermoanaerobaculia bacterium]
MELPNQKEQFSAAYVRAIASVAGYAVSRPEVDDDSVDLTLSARGGNGSLRSPKLDIQLKCTARRSSGGPVLRFPLKRKNYDDLRGHDFLVPRILVVVTVPEKLPEWLVQSEEQLSLRHCGYWLSLREAPATRNEASVTVEISRENLLSVETLARIMKGIAQGEKP